MRKTGLASLLCVLGLTFGVQLAIGQPPGGQPPDGKGGRPPGGGRRPGMGGEAALRLLEMAEVQKDLALTPEQKSNIPLLKEEMKEGDKKFAESMSDSGISRDERMAKFGERAKEIDKQIAEVLGDKHKRYKQIRWQTMGLTQALSMEAEVRDALKWTKEQGDAMRDAMRSFFDDMRKKSAENPSGMEAAFEKMREQQNAKAMELLTEDQKAKWTELIGAPITFKLSAQDLFGRGGRRGPGGPDNPPPKKQPDAQPKT